MDLCVIPTKGMTWVPRKPNHYVTCHNIRSTLGNSCTIMQCQSVNQGSLAMPSALQQFGCVSCSTSLLVTKYFRIVYIESRDSC